MMKHLWDVFQSIVYMPDFKDSIYAREFQGTRVATNSLMSR